MRGASNSLKAATPFSGSVRRRRSSHGDPPLSSSPDAMFRASCTASRSPVASGAGGRWDCRRCKNGRLLPAQSRRRSARGVCCGSLVQRPALTASRSSTSHGCFAVPASPNPTVAVVWRSGSSPLGKSMGSAVGVPIAVQWGIPINFPLPAKGQVGSGLVIQGRSCPDSSSANGTRTPPKHGLEL